MCVGMWLQVIRQCPVSSLIILCSFSEIRSLVALGLTNLIQLRWSLSLLPICLHFSQVPNYKQMPCFLKHAFWGSNSVFTNVYRALYRRTISCTLICPIRNDPCGFIDYFILNNSSSSLLPLLNGNMIVSTEAFVLENSRQQTGRNI